MGNQLLHILAWHLQNLNWSEKVSRLFSFSLFYFMKLYANGTREVRERLQIHPSSMSLSDSSLKYESTEHTT